MTFPRTVKLGGFFCSLILMAAPIRGAVQQQQVTPAEGQVLHVLVNKSVVINTQSPIVRVLSSNPTAIDTVATSPTQIVISGKAPGTSSLIIWDMPDHSQILDVVVEPDVSALRMAVERTYVGQQIGIETDGTRIILSGTVASQKIADDIGKLAAAYAMQVVNLLTTAPPTHDPQVLLEVRFAEVDRNKIEQLGVNILSTGATNTIGTVSTQQFGAPTLGGAGVGGPTATNTLQISDILNVFLFRPDLNLAVTIRDLENKALLQILAEPNLLALNGQKASFLAGGEFPFPVVQGGQNIGAVTIQFRPFGVQLDFTGTVGVDNVIRLHVAPQVSTLDFANAVTISGFTVPAFSTRRAETEIELRDGQSFGIAGLMDRRAQTQMSKIPGIADIPILGTLFKSKNINRGNTELMVIVTPHILRPLEGPVTAPQQPTYPMPFLQNPSFDKNVPGNDNVGASGQPK